MALFWSCPPPFSVLQPRTNFPILISSTLETLIPNRNAPRLCSVPISSSFNHCRTFSSRLSSDSSIGRDESPSSRVFIKGLAQSTSEGSLIKAFSQFGEVSRVKVITDKKATQSLGFAYIWFTTEESAELAVKEMNGKFFDGRFVFVTIARLGPSKRRGKAIPYKF